MKPLLKPGAKCSVCGKETKTPRTDCWMRLSVTYNQGPKDPPSIKIGWACSPEHFVALLAGTYQVAEALVAQMQRGREAKVIAPPEQGRIILVQ